MTTSRYRVLIVAFVVLSILGGAIDFIFPSLLSSEFRQVQHAQDNSLPALSLLLFVGLGFTGGLLALASTYGLYFFRPWAPSLAIWGTAIAILCWPFAGAYAQSGLTIATSYVASYLWGAIIVLAYIGPISTKFKRYDG